MLSKITNKFQITIPNNFLSGALQKFLCYWWHSSDNFLDQSQRACCRNRP